MVVVVVPFDALVVEVVSERAMHRWCECTLLSGDYTKYAYIADLKFGKILGQGGFGTVFRGEWVSKGIEVAMKKVGVPPEACDVKVIYMAELGKHPHILGFFGYGITVPCAVQICTDLNLERLFSVVTTSVSIYGCYFI